MPILYEQGLMSMNDLMADNAMEGTTPKVQEVKASHGRILVVDDERVTQRLLKASMVKRDYEVETAANVMEAIAILEREGRRTFDCALVDYRMPGQTGIDLLVWLKSFDPTLASMMLTAEGDKLLVAKILREGAVDYLDKPVNLRELGESVTKAVAISRERRYLADTESAASKVGEAHHHLLGIRQLSRMPQVRICYQPMHQAGGDFINVFPQEDGKYVVIAGDISGHDLRAAYVSTFAQGVVRGMMEKSAEIGEVFEFFNRFLVTECNVVDGARSESQHDTTSLAMCSASIDPSRSEVTVMNSGFPCPLYVDPEGVARELGIGCCPLGWFDDLIIPKNVFPFAVGGCLYFWSDGLEDYAEKIKICGPSLAFRLLEVGEAERKSLLRDAIDDVLIVQLSLGEESLPVVGFQPLIVESYSGADLGMIDEMQSKWERSLRYALPELADDRLYDVLLASREGMLNAMQHGCRGRADRVCNYQVFYRSDTMQIHVRISDPGDGYMDDFLECDDPLMEPFERHCGFIILRAFSSTIKKGRNGALLMMDFEAVESRPLAAQVEECETVN